MGERLKEERERLGWSQQKLADTCGVTMRSQRNYEKSERHPDANYIAALAAVGLNVMYILTGKLSYDLAPTTEPLSVRERHLLDNYRGSNEEGRRAVESTASALAHRDSAKQTGRGK
ncbi:helix-turn-helix transcriptional regulator [uncultured Gilvimarinus sp.]|uniref:helix-turn-helix domain-containing protein n=1 Tax=uncultured Gilvimarinus sp. TaxID=1689143 RepID=UPI0030DA8756